MISKKFITIFYLCILITACDESEIELNVEKPEDSYLVKNDLQENILGAINSTFEKVEYPDVEDSDYEHVVRFDTVGILHWNNMPAALGDPVEVWISVLGEPNRTRGGRFYLWDDLGVTVYTAGSDAILNDPTLNGTVSGFVVSFDDRYDDLGQYDIGRDPGGRPIGYFAGLIRFGDAWIDRERKVSEFLDYESTRTLEDSFDRSLVFRDIFDNENGEKIYFSITQGLSRAFPEGPDNVSASIIR